MIQATKTETYDAALDQEMHKFYRAFAVAQTNMILHLTAARDSDDLRIRAAEVTQQLGTIVIKNERGDKCERGTIYNPITRECD